MPLINEHYAGYRPQRWDEQTEVTFEIRLPENPEAIPEPYVTMSQTPVFGPLDQDQSQDIKGRDALIAALKIGTVLITFTNAQGEIKEMICTTNEGMIPHDQRPKPALALEDIVLSANPATIAIKPQDPQLLKVYAIDRCGWRSVRAERVLQYRLLNTI